jgi:nitric oxide dioxygenase
MSGVLHEATEGTTFELSAPYGCFNLDGVEKLWLSKPDAPVVFLSGGVGITPVLAMLESIYTTRPASWLHSATNGQTHAYRERLCEIASVRNGALTRRVWYSKPVEADGEPGARDNNSARFHFKGRMDLVSESKAFAPHVLHLGNPEAQYFMCGSPGWMEAQKKGLISLGVDESRIHSEDF